MSDPSFKQQLATGDAGALSAVAHAQGVSEASTYKSIGGGLEFSGDGRGASVTADHYPGRGNKLTAAASANLVSGGPHQLDVNAYSSRRMPYAGPAHSVHGAGADYSFNKTLGASAAVSHTPAANRTDVTLSGQANLHRTPTSSLDFNVQSGRSHGPQASSKWNTQGSFSYRRDF